MSGLHLEILPDFYAVCRLPVDADEPAWARDDAFTSVTRTPDELSIVCRVGAVPQGVRAETGWRLLKVEGPLALAQTGVLASIAQPLAQAAVSIFTISTFDTDYVLVRDEDLVRSIDALTRAGHHLSMEL